jgi:hypothetical protein
MNRTRQFFFLLLFPALPFWAWFLYFFTDRPIGVFLTLVLIPIASILLIMPRINIPRYLGFFMLFTFYHLCSVYINNLVPPETNSLKFLLSDRNVLACLFFFVIENTHFDERFIRNMNRNVLLIVLISLIISLIQIWYPFFFVSPRISGNIESSSYVLESRITSIYTWIDLNSLGISFPIFISILLSLFHDKKTRLPFIVISGVIVSFLSRARYVMLSTIIAFSQLFFVSKIEIRKKFYIILIFTCSLLILFSVAKVIGYNINQVINERILEKNTNMGSFNARIFSYYVFLNKFPEHPLLGVGPETKSDVIRLLDGIAPMIHVGFLSYLYYYGLVGCFFLFLSIYYLLNDAWIVGKKYEFWGSFYGLLSFCFANTTMVYFNFSEMGIILVAIYLRYYNQKSISELASL